MRMTGASSWASSRSVTSGIVHQPVQVDLVLGRADHGGGVAGVGVPPSAGTQLGVVAVWRSGTGPWRRRTSVMAQEGVSGLTTSSSPSPARRKPAARRHRAAVPAPGAAAGGRARQHHLGLVAQLAQLQRGVHRALVARHAGAHHVTLPARSGQGVGLQGCTRRETAVASASVATSANCRRCCWYPADRRARRDRWRRSAGEHACTPRCAHRPGFDGGQLPRFGRACVAGGSRQGSAPEPARKSWGCPHRHAGRRQAPACRAAADGPPAAPGSAPAACCSGSGSAPCRRPNRAPRRDAGTPSGWSCVRARVANRLPSTGIEPSTGTWSRLFVTLSSSRPPSTMIWPSSSSTLVSMARLLVTSPAATSAVRSMLLTS